MGPECDWTLKIAGYIHDDPPDKALYYHDPTERDATSRAQAAAAVLLTSLLSRTGDRAKHVLGKGGPAKQADHIASAADRLSIDSIREAAGGPGEASRTQTLQVAWRGWNRHPLSGEPWQVTRGLPEATAPAAYDAISGEVSEAVARVVKAAARDDTEAIDPKRLYLMLWRKLQAWLAEGPGDWWDVIPATTRMPDIPIWSHARATAAIATALDGRLDATTAGTPCRCEPAHVVFQIGPVQEFIRAARRTQDFWMGSWLISYLSWQAMKVFANAYGPDCIMYPSLWSQPLADRWLRDEMDLSAVVEDPGSHLDVASLPHRFVALVPEQAAQGLVGAATEAVQVEWIRVAEAVHRRLACWGGAAWDDRCSETCKRQIDQPWRIVSTVYPWPKPEARTDDLEWAKRVVSEYETLSGVDHDADAATDKAGVYDNPDFARAWPFFVGEKPDPGDAKAGWRTGQVRAGTCYSLISTLASRFHDSVKASRTFGHATESGDLCTVCGTRAAIAPEAAGGPRYSDRTRDLWRKIASSLQAKGRYREVKPDGAERLCAVCATKRFAHYEYFGQPHSDTPLLDDRRRFPSTSTIAAADFVADLIHELAKPAGAHPERLRAALAGFASLLRRSPLPRTARRSILPRHVTLLREYWEQLRGCRHSLMRLLWFDGDVLYKASLTKDRLIADYGDDDPRVLPLIRDEEALGALREAQGRLLGAADKAGVRAPSRYFAVLALDGDGMRQWLSGEKAPLISEIVAPEVRACAEFQRYWKPVHDVRRFVSPSFHAAISAALSDFALKLAKPIVEDKYPGKLIYAGGDDLLALVPARCALAVAQDLRCAFTGQGTWQNGKWQSSPKKPSGYVAMGERVLCLMGSTASASIGIAISHHIQPLIKAIGHAFDACHERAKRVPGKDAIAVEVLKRGGAPVTAVSHFHGPGPGPGIADTIAEAVDLLSDAGPDSLSAGVPHELAKDEPVISQLPLAAQVAELGRVLDRQSGAMPEGSEERRRLEDLGDRLKGLLNPETLALSYTELVNWLLVARFLACEGGDD